MIATTLANLLQGVYTDAEALVLECSGLQLDSRMVQPSDLYIANVGADSRVDGFVRQALEAGAVAVLVDTQAVLGDDLVQLNNVLLVRDLAEKTGLISARYYDHPSQNMLLIGVTGTNGKTSCCVMQAQLLALLGLKANYIGTLGAGAIDKLAPTGFTTPPADVLQQLLYRAYTQSVRAVALEVSSHGIAQHRIGAINIDVAVLTNLSQDHLDFHGSMQKYGAVKAKLFTLAGVKTAVINIDDDYGAALADELVAGMRVLRVSLRARGADFYLSDIVTANVGFTAKLHGPDGVFEITTPLLGEFNLYNLLLVAAATNAAGYALHDIAPKLGVLEAPQGRMQLVAKQRPQVIVDYAHTPDALEKACDAVRSHCEGRLILVFGCGGDRDVGKRPVMGAVAAAKADLIILTNDNPRSESPDEIAEQILLGIPVGALVLLELDRRKAIFSAIKEAKLDDCVLIAGKGHEHYQDIAGERLPFADAYEARSALAEVAA